MIASNSGTPSTSNGIRTGVRFGFRREVKGGHDTDDGQAVAQEMTSAVSHEDFSGGTVMEKEAQGAAAGDGCEHGDEMLLPERCNQQQIHGGNHRCAAGQSVHIVKEIQGIDDRHDPKHGDDPAEQLVADAKRQARSPSGCNCGNQKLQKKLFACAHWFVVIDNAKQSDQSGACRDQRQIFPDIPDSRHDEIEISWKQVFCGDTDQNPAADGQQPGQAHADATATG